MRTAAAAFHSLPALASFRAMFRPARERGDENVMRMHARLANLEYAQLHDSQDLLRAAQGLQKICGNSAWKAASEI